MIRTTNRILKELARKSVWTLTAGLLALLGVDLLQLMVPRMIRQAVDDLTLGKADSASLFGQAGAIVAMALGMALLRLIWRPCVMGFARLLERELRWELFSHLQILHLDFFRQNPPGEIMSRATYDLNNMRMAVGMGMVMAIDSLVLSVFAVIFMLQISPILTLVALFPMPMVVWLTRYMTRRMHSSFMEAQERNATLTEMAREALAGIRVVKLFALHGREEARLARAGRQYLETNLDLARLTAFFWPGMVFLSSLCLAAVLGLGGPLAVWGRISTGDFVAFTAYLGLLTWPMMGLGWMTNLVQRARASQKRVDHILCTEPAITDPPHPLELDRQTGLGVEVRGLSFTYPGAREPVLRDVDLSVRHGHATAVVGRIGCGKSTLLRLMARLYEPPAGGILVEGADLTQIRRKDLREHLVVVPQNAFMFSASLRSNLALGRPEAGEPELWAALEAARLDTEARALKDGLDTQLGERGQLLSGGQRQRLALARALLLDPAILVLDDPLSEVDTDTESAILANLARVRRGKTTLLVSHRLKSVAFASMIYVMDRGRVVQKGSHQELMGQPGLYHDLFAEQTLLSELQR